MATHSSVLAWRLPWTEEPGGLQSKGSQRVGHNCCDAHTGHGIPINSAHEEGSSCGYYCYACSKLSAGRRRHGEHGVQGQGCRPGALGWWEDPRSMGRTRSLTNRVRQRTKPLCFCNKVPWGQASLLKVWSGPELWYPLEAGKEC